MLEDKDGRYYSIRWGEIVSDTVNGMPIQKIN